MAHVSVIIPAYNAEAFIVDTVNSALNQSYTDLEVIVVDDGSKDGTVAALATFGDRIRVHQQSNGGVAKARNTGVSLATGPWVAFLDADDLWLPEKIERQLARAKTAPMVYSDRLNIGARGDLPELQSQVTQMHDGDVFVPLLRENFITNTSVLIDRALFEKLDGFYTGLNGTEDWDLWIRVAERHPIALVPEPLVKYRFHEASISRNWARMSRERTQVIARALALPRGVGLDWVTRRQIWAETWRTNGWDAGRSGARLHALGDYARAALAWPLYPVPYKEALKVCLNV